MSSALYNLANYYYDKYLDLKITITNTRCQKAIMQKKILIHCDKTFEK